MYLFLIFSNGHLHQIWPRPLFLDIKSCFSFSETSPRSITLRACASTEKGGGDSIEFALPRRWLALGVTVPRRPKDVGLQLPTDLRRQMDDKVNYLRT